MFRLELLFLVLVICYVTVSVRSERIVQQESPAMAMDKMDAMMHRLDQLESSVSTLRAQCGCQTQKFLDGESSTGSRGRPSTGVPLAAIQRCSPKAQSICRQSGLADIDLAGKQVKVLCDTDRWLVVLQRFDGSVPFHNKNWQAFKQGFGTVAASNEFFIGLQNLHDLTGYEDDYELRIEMVDWSGVRKWAQYSNFHLGNEQTAYRLSNLGTYTGDAGDSFSYHQGQGFTTLDRDNDGKQSGSCGEEFNSAGWFKSCMEANLMGRYQRAEVSNFKEGMYWETFHGPEYSLKSVKMSIRVKC